MTYLCLSEHDIFNILYSLLNNIYFFILLIVLFHGNEMVCIIIIRIFCNFLCFWLVASHVSLCLSGRFLSRISGLDLILIVISLAKQD